VSSSPDATPRAAAVIVAGGAGRRVGGEVAKQFLEVRGIPILQRAIIPFLEHPGIGPVIVVLPPGDVLRQPQWLRELAVGVVAGGAERSDSVWNGLRALPDDADPVLIHDGARPFVSREIIDRILAAAQKGPAIAAIPVSDTIKEVDAERRIVATPERARLWQAQTPQGFPRALLIAAHGRARSEGRAATDDAVLVEHLGAHVAIVEGSAENIKITRPVDLIFAEALAAQGVQG
jgi:2-C-methyl-D-erythritol 4-phosphate cytidylyltransferase